MNGHASTRRGAGSQLILIAVAALGLGIIAAGLVVTRGSGQGGGETATATPTPTMQAVTGNDASVAASESYKQFVSQTGQLTGDVTGYDPQDTRHIPPQVETQLGF